MSDKLKEAKDGILSDLLFIAIFGLLAIGAAMAIVKACGLNH